MINCTITSPTKTISYNKLQSITLPASLGQMQILPGHAESFILLQKGNIVLERPDKSSEVIQIVAGECYVKNDAMVVIL